MKYENIPMKCLTKNSICFMQKYVACCIHCAEIWHIVKYHYVKKRKLIITIATTTKTTIRTTRTTIIIINITIILLLLVLIIIIIIIIVIIFNKQPLLASASRTRCIQVAQINVCKDLNDNHY